MTCCVSLRQLSGRASIRWQRQSWAARAQRAWASPSVQDFRAFPGKGVVGTVVGRRVALGNASLFVDLGISFDAWAERVEMLRRDGKTVMLVAVDNKAAGIIAVADPVKASTPEAIAQLHRSGVRIAMVTGDSEATARSVAKRTGN
jgi:Cu+-exporting ATPase